MRTALVTGVSRGTGRGIASSLARQGYGMTISSRNDADPAALAVELRNVGAAQVVHRAADKADHESVPAIVDAHRAAFSTMDTLILAAGVGTAGPSTPIHCGAWKRPSGSTSAQRSSSFNTRCRFFARRRRRA